MSVDDHGLEVLKKSAEQLTPGNWAEYLLRTRVVSGPGAGATTPTIYNTAVTLADTEYSQALSPSTKAFMVRVRGSASLKLAFAAGQSGTNFLNIPAGANYTVWGVEFSGVLYFQCPKSSQVVEIIEWA